MAKRQKGHPTPDTGIVRESDGKLRVGPIRGVPDITSAEIGQIAAWFLGPRGENSRVFRTMIDHAVDRTIAYRKSFEPDDPAVITDDVRSSDAYRRAVESMLRAYEDLVDFLQDYTTPYFSMRYQGHMLRDNTLPALCGYFAAMLHNPNNVTIQASSATTPLEIVVGRDLCGMVGFEADTSPDAAAYEPWAHITCDGSVANLEACWSLREVKFLPLALHRMLLEADVFSFVSSCGTRRTVQIDNDRHPITVVAANGEEICLSDTSAEYWLLMNLPLDEILGLPDRIAASYGIGDAYAVWSAAIPYTLNYVGWGGVRDYCAGRFTEHSTPVMLAPVTTHYSLLKSAALLGYGFGESGGILHVAVDEYGRMDMEDFGRLLEHCQNRRIPVATVVGVAGTTEEGAVDNFAEMLRMREQFRLRGLDFFLHADSAWGGYMISAMRSPFSFLRERETERPEEHVGSAFVGKEAAPFSDYVYEQFRHLRECDSVTIDPHKMGYVQYPAGSILYRNGALRRLTTFTGPYIGGTGSIDPGREPTAGIYGVEGSRPGAAPAAVFMSHRVIRPDVTGHGKIIRQSMVNTRLFALHLLALGERSRCFDLTLLNGGVGLAEGQGAAELLSAGPAAVTEALESDVMRNFGPDLNILNYVFNPLSSGGVPNRDVQVLNSFNLSVYERFHVPVAEMKARRLPVPMEEFPRLFITMTRFGRQEYGDRFFTHFLKAALGLEEDVPLGQVDRLVCLRSVIMDPFMAYTDEGDFCATLMEHFGQVLEQMVHEWREGKMAAPDSPNSTS